MNALTRVSVSLPCGLGHSPAASVKERLEWIERFRSSGLTQQAFAQAHSLNLGRFRYWLYDPTLQRKNQGGAPRLQEFSVGQRTTALGWGAEVCLPAGPTVRLNEALARELIGPLLRGHPANHV